MAEVIPPRPLPHTHTHTLTHSMPIYFASRHIKLFWSKSHGASCLLQLCSHSSPCPDTKSCCRCPNSPVIRYFLLFFTPLFFSGLYDPHRCPPTHPHPHPALHSIVSPLLICMHTSICPQFRVLLLVFLASLSTTTDALGTCLIRPSTSVYYC